MERPATQLTLAGYLHLRAIPTQCETRFAGNAQQGWRECTAERQYMFHWACLYVEAGLSVLPLLGKKPALPSWKEFTTRRPNYDELRDWFGKSSEHNIGIIGGKVSQGLVIVDCDSVEDLKWWLSEHPASPMMVRTGRGGLHVYYTVPPACDLGNRAKLFGRLIDLKCEAGYCVAPPSVSPITGKAYEWVESGIHNFCPVHLPQFDPGWIEMEAQVEKVKGSGKSDEGELVTSERSHRTQKRIDGLLRHLDTEVDDRSRRDFSVVAGLFRLRLSRHEVAELVKGHSKFATNGNKYLEKTLDNAERAIRGP